MAALLAAERSREALESSEMRREVDVQKTSQENKQGFLLKH